MVAITGTGLPSFMPGLKRHFSHRFDGLLIQAQTQRAQHLQISADAVFVHHQRQHHRALPLGFAGFFGIFGLDLAAGTLGAERRRRSGKRRRRIRRRCRDQRPRLCRIRRRRPMPLPIPPPEPMPFEGMPSWLSGSP